MSDLGSFDKEVMSGLCGTRMVMSVSSTAKKYQVDAPMLAKNWGISLEQAAKTIQVTTQRGLMTVLHPSLSRRFRTNDRQLRYRRLNIELYSDTQESSTNPEVGISMQRFLVQEMDGPGSTPWQRNQMPMRVCHCCLPEMVFHQG
jgi:hypothetical protein